MNNINDIVKLADTYCQSCELALVKIARIRKLPNGQYRVLSEKGKNLGTYKSRAAAAKRLKQVEYFKHVDKSNAAVEIEISKEEPIIDLTEIDEYAYSAIVRKLRKVTSPKQVNQFLEIYKKIFDKCVKSKMQNPEKVALQNALIRFSKLYKIKLNKKMIKNAAISELGDPVQVGRYLADIIRFSLNRISVEMRPSAVESLRQKIYNLNETEIASKNLPATSALGQSITFVKHVLFNHDPQYIREVLNNIVRNL